MTAQKKKQKSKNPDEWLVEAYNSQNKGQLAQMLVDCNFDKEGGPFPIDETEHVQSCPIDPNCLVHLKKHINIYSQTTNVCQDRVEKGINMYIYISIYHVYIYKYHVYIIKI